MARGSVQQGRPADPGRQLLRLPRPRSEPPARGACGSTARSREGGARHRATCAIVPGSPRQSALYPARHGSGRAEADAARLERQDAPDRRPDRRRCAALDRGGRRVGAALVVHPARARRPRRAVKRAGWAPQPGRRLRPRRDREGRAPRRRRRPSAASCCGRLSFDLTGLPPTPDEVRAFLGRHARRGATSGRWTACWPRPLRRAHGRSSGSTSCATPTASATTATTRARSGATATRSSTPSTGTCPSTASPP